MTQKEVLESVKHSVLSVEPSANILLYGSRARGDAVVQSDWDFLILVDGPVNEQRKRTLRHRLYEVEWASGEVISSIILSQEEWNDNRHRSTPFYETVLHEGVTI